MIECFRVIGWCFPETGRDRNFIDFFPDELFDTVEFSLFRLGNEGQRNSLGICPRCTPDSVDIIFRVVRYIKVDNPVSYTHLDVYKRQTNDRPKALVELEGKTLLERVIERMKEVEIERLVINIHHFADKIRAFLQGHDNFGMDIVLSEEREELLDTGGGVLKARDLFIPGKPVLIHNVDILTDLNLNALIRQHKEHDAYATLVVKPCLADRVLKFNQGVLKGWENKRTGEQKIVDEGFYEAREYNLSLIHI